MADDDTLVVDAVKARITDLCAAFHKTMPWPPPRIDASGDTECLLASDTHWWTRTTQSGWLVVDRSKFDVLVGVYLLPGAPACTMQLMIGGVYIGAQLLEPGKRSFVLNDEYALPLSAFAYHEVVVRFDPQDGELLLTVAGRCCFVGGVTRSPVWVLHDDDPASGGWWGALHPMPQTQLSSCSDKAETYFWMVSGMFAFDYSWPPPEGHALPCEGWRSRVAEKRAWLDNLRTELLAAAWHPKRMAYWLCCDPW